MVKKLGMFLLSITLGSINCANYQKIKTNTKVKEASEKITPIETVIQENSCYYVQLELTDFTIEGAHLVRFKKIKPELFDYFTFSVDEIRNVTQKQTQSITFLEIIYENGFIEKYWDTNEDLKIDFVEIVKDNIVTFYDINFIKKNLSFLYKLRKEEANLKFLLSQERTYGEEKRIYEFFKNEREKLETLLNNFEKKFGYCLDRILLKVLKK